MVKVIIPAFNEENGIRQVLKDIPYDLVNEVIVVNNASTDQTSLIAEKEGATVLTEPQKGYGRACLKGLGYINELKEKPEVIVFLDADYSDYPEEMIKLLAPINSGKADLVIGSRALGKRQKGSMTPQQIFGNFLATKLIRLFYGIKFTDLGPFRAVRYDTLLKMNMQDKTYGWTVEMQLKAAKMGVKSVEVPVSYRPRIGFSKISGTVRGTVMAGYKIITTIFKYL